MSIKATKAVIWLVVVLIVSVISCYMPTQLMGVWTVACFFMGVGLQVIMESL